MLQRGRWFRLQAIVALAIFCVGAGSQVYGYHGCEHHGALGAGRHAASGHAASVGAHSGHAEAAHVHRGMPAPAGESPEDAGPCTCVGNCYGSAGLALPTTLIAAAPTAGAVAAMAPAEADAAVQYRRPNFLLPYANAPPSRI